MTYRILRQDFRPEHWTAIYVEGVNSDAVSSGVPVADVPGPAHVMLYGTGRTRVDILEQPALVVSQAVRAVFDRAGIDNIQYFPAELQLERSQRVERGFWIANVIGKVSCVDRNASNYESGGDDLGPVLQFQIDPSRTYGLSIFRLAEVSGLVIVSPRIQAALEAAELQGLFLQDPRTYNGNLVNTADHRQVLTVNP